MSSDGSWSEGGPRVLFMGSGEIAIPSFERLIATGRAPCALVTQPDRPAGRRRELRPPPIKRVAEAAGLPVLQPERVRRREALDEIGRQRPELIVVMAYGQILPAALIEMPALGCVNLHASLLPKYRGAACIQAAIDAGDEVTGVSLMHMVPELDAGDVIAAREEPIFPEDTGGVVHDRLAGVAADLLETWLPALLDGRAPRTPQAELGEPSLVPKLERDDGRIDWGWSAERIERRLRAYDPWPGCWAEYVEGGERRRLKLFPGRVAWPVDGEPGEVEVGPESVRVACGEGALELGEVQGDGSRRMDARDWWRGRPQVRGLD